MSISIENLFTTIDITVRRREPGAWVRGIYEKGNEVELIIRGSIEPMSPYQVQKEIQGERSTEAIKIFSIQRLFVSDEAQSIPSDLVEHDGKVFEVVSSKNWSVGVPEGLRHFESVAFKFDDSGGGATP